MPVKYTGMTFIQLAVVIAGVAVGGCCFPDSSLAAHGTLPITFITASSSLNFA